LSGEDVLYCTVECQLIKKTLGGETFLEIGISWGRHYNMILDDEEITMIISTYLHSTIIFQVASKLVSAL
jgi:hypothetical protein